MFRLDILVSGRVQGVSFRYFTQDIARNLGIVGWCRNMRDGKVEIVSYGEKTILEKFLGYVKQGPPASQVIDAQIEWKTVSQADYKDFSIKF